MTAIGPSRRLTDGSYQIIALVGGAVGVAYSLETGGSHVVRPKMVDPNSRLPIGFDLRRLERRRPCPVFVVSVHGGRTRPRRRWRGCRPHCAIDRSLPFPMHWFEPAHGHVDDRQPLVQEKPEVGLAKIRAEEREAGNMSKLLPGVAVEKRALQCS